MPNVIEPVRGAAPRATRTEEVVADGPEQRPARPAAAATAQPPVIRQAEELADGTFRVSIDDSATVATQVFNSRADLIAYARANGITWAVEDAAVAAPPPPRAAPEPPAARPDAPRPPDAVRPRSSRTRSNSDVKERQLSLLRLGLNSVLLDKDKPNTDGRDGPLTRIAHARFFKAGDGAIFSAYWKTLSEREQAVFGRQNITPETIAQYEDWQIANLFGATGFRFPEPATKRFITAFERGVAACGPLESWQSRIPAILSAMAATPGAPVTGTGAGADTRPPPSPSTGGRPGEPAPGTAPSTPGRPTAPGTPADVAPPAGQTPGAPPAAVTAPHDCPDPKVAEARGYLLALTSGNITREQARRIAQAIATVEKANGADDDAVAHAITVLHSGLAAMVTNSMAGPGQAVRFLNALEDRDLAGRLVAGILKAEVPAISGQTSPYGGYGYLTATVQRSVFVRELLQPENNFVTDATFLKALHRSGGYDAIVKQLGTSSATDDRVALARLLGNLYVVAGIQESRIYTDLTKVLVDLVNSNEHDKAVAIIKSFSAHGAFAGSIAYKVADQIGAGDWDRDDYLKALLAEDKLLDNREFMRVFVEETPGPGDAHELIRSALLSGNVSIEERHAYLRFVAKAMRVVPATSRDLWLDSAAEQIAELSVNPDRHDLAADAVKLMAAAGAPREAGILARRGIAKNLDLDVLDIDADDLIFELFSKGSLLDNDEFLRGFAFTDAGNRHVDTALLGPNGNLEKLIGGWATAEEKALYRRIMDSVGHVLPEDWQGQLSRRVKETVGR